MGNNTVFTQRHLSTTSPDLLLATSPFHFHMQFVVLCWAHACIGWSFFIMSAYLPQYLTFLGIGSLTSTGFLAGLPFLAAAIVGAVAGGFADKMLAADIPRLQVSHRGKHHSPPYRIIQRGLGMSQVSRLVKCLNDGCVESARESSQRRDVRRRSNGPSFK